MAITQKDEARALSADERELVKQSHHPALQGLSDAELTSLVKLMRDRRGKAKTQADQRRREMRGKSDPKGATASKADEGSRQKVAVLATAMRRLNSEVERRGRMCSHLSLVENANKVGYRDVGDNLVNTGQYFDAFYFIGPRDVQSFFLTEGETLTAGIQAYFARKFAYDPDFRVEYSDPNI